MCIIQSKVGRYVISFYVQWVPNLYYLAFLKKPFVRPFEDDYDATTNQAKNCQKKPNSNHHVIKEESSKGQIISEGNCGVFKFPKKKPKFSEGYLS